MNDWKEKLKSFAIVVLVTAGAKWVADQAQAKQVEAQTTATVKKVLLEQKNMEEQQKVKES